MKRLSVRARLLAALALLAAATLIVGAIAWAELDRTTGRVDRLHRDTLGAVDAALTLSRQAAGVATRAPYMMTLDSPFRIAQEGEATVALVEDIAAGLAATDPLRRTLDDMRGATGALVEDMQARALLRDRTLRFNAELAKAERRFAALAATTDASLAERQDWFTLQRTAAALLGAGRADNLISVGEHQREYHVLTHRPGTEALRYGTADMARLRTIAEGREGLFELRRLELARQIGAEAALVRIRKGAAAVIDHAGRVTATAQGAIAAERTRTTSAIAVQKSVIVSVGLASAALALAAALYVSGYVTGNLRAASDAMMRLAAGDRSSRLPRGEGAGDEIGKLFHAFRTFRANALRLDRSNRQMRQRTALFENMMAGISDGVAILSDNGAILARNPRLAQVLRLDPAATPARAGLDELIALGGWQTDASATGLTQLSGADGHFAVRRDSPLPGGGAVVLISDTTELRRVDERMQQIQRIEALGKVTGEVAHDFGNILSTIIGSVHLMETTPAAGQRELRGSISSAAELGSALVQRLLAFARRQRLTPEVVELNGLVEGMADLISFALREDIALDIRPAPEPLTVRVDPGQLESALLNLCLNAGQAIAGAGTITLTVTAQGGMAAIEVADTGRGMTPEVMRHAMEPFYSARSDGTGTGLGLAMVYGFIRQSGGDVQIASAEGRGTTIRLVLPRDSAARPQEPLPWRRVLLVEDDATDRATGLAVLAGADTEVVACAEAGAALDALAEGDFDLVVTDLSLQGAPAGWQVAEAALAAYPGAAVAVVSGHLPATNPLAPRHGARVALLGKPLDRAALIAALPFAGTEPDDDRT